MENEVCIISIDEACEKIKHGAVVLDVRTKKEFDEGHLDDALHIPHDELAIRLAELAPFRDREICVYCKSGGRSQYATELLRAAKIKAAWNAGAYLDLSAELQRRA